MIRQEFFRWPEMFLIRNPGIVNIGFAVVFVCFAVITYKIYYTQDGKFRQFLLCYFGSSAFWAFGCMLLYHPFYNIWIPWALAIPNVIANIRLTMYIAVNLGVGRRKSTRLPAPYTQGENHYETRRNSYNH